MIPSFLNSLYIFVINPLFEVEYCRIFICEDIYYCVWFNKDLNRQIAKQEVKVGLLGRERRKEVNSEVCETWREAIIQNEEVLISQHGCNVYYSLYVFFISVREKQTTFFNHFLCDYSLCFLY